MDRNVLLRVHAGPRRKRPRRERQSRTGCERGVGEQQRGAVRSEPEHRAQHSAVPPLHAHGALIRTLRRTNLHP